MVPESVPYPVERLSYEPDPVSPAAASRLRLAGNVEVPALSRETPLPASTAVPARLRE